MKLPEPKQLAGDEPPSLVGKENRLPPATSYTFGSPPPRRGVGETDGAAQAQSALSNASGWLAAILTAVFAVAAMASAFAGPPFLTDDPEPVSLHHWELYEFGSGDRTRGVDTVAGPAMELNNGVAKNTQLHLVVPRAYFSQNGMSSSGLGDIEAGVKYRVIEQTGSRPDVGVFPQAELATGDSSKGLGNGRTWYKAPLWIEKDRGAWTDYGGGGFAYNPAPGQRNYWFGGNLLQRTLSPKLALGAEIFLRGATADVGQSGQIEVPGSRSTTLWNVGGQYNFSPDFSLLFSAGHSLAGEGNSVFYLGLYRTWGSGAP